MRETRVVQTFRKAPIPLNRKTGATTSWMICATALTDESSGAIGGTASLSTKWVLIRRKLAAPASRIIRQAEYCIS
jgi:hypothetical protein